MTTYGELQSAVQRGVADTDGQVFTTPVAQDLIGEAMAEVGRFSPSRFQEDLTPVADQLEYQLQSAIFADETPELEVSKVEVWDGSLTPARFLRLLQSQTSQPSRNSEAGWRLWNGVLSIPNQVEDWLDPDTHVIRVWGYRPYAIPSSDSDVLGMSNAQEKAVLSLCKVNALMQLLASRDLYTQWQTRANNADVSPASLMNQLSLAQEDWRRKARQLAVIRD